MPPFSVTPKRFEKYRDVIARKRNHQCLNLRQKLIHQCRAVAPSASQFDLHDHLRLRYRGCANSDRPRSRYLPEQFLIPGFPANHSHHRR